MRALFKELPVFERVRSDYLDDEQYRQLQQALLANPEAGDVIEGTGGLRKLRHADDLTPDQRKVLRQLLKNELDRRQSA